MIKIINGDLIKLALNGEFDYIVHGCNSFHIMGAGIAKQIKETFPSAYLIDKKTFYGDFQKLGTWSIAEVQIQGHRNLNIVNAYTQYYPGANAEYLALITFLKNFDSYLYTINRQYSRIGIPMIGCGIGGLNEDAVYKLLEEYWGFLDVTLVKFNGE